MNLTAVRIQRNILSREKKIDPEEIITMNIYQSNNISTKYMKHQKSE